MRDVLQKHAAIGSLEEDEPIIAVFAIVANVAAEATLARYIETQAGRIRADEAGFRQPDNAIFIVEHGQLLSGPQRETLAPERAFDLRGREP